MKTFKKILIILVIVVGVIFVNGCYFVFHGQFKATKKVNTDIELNTYEIFSAYTMHTACWMFGWVIEPTVAKLAFCSQFHIIPDNGHQISKHVPTNDKIESIKSKMKIGDKVKLTFPNYETKAAILFNGSTLIYNSFYEFEHECKRKHWTYLIPMDYKPGIVSIANIKISETLFDYLEQIDILKPFSWKYEVIEPIYK